MEGSTTGGTHRELDETSAILERELELGSLRGAIEAARAGRGRMLVLEGPGGIGKSRLLREARRMCATAGLDVLHARGAALESDYPFGVVLSLFEPRVENPADPARDALFRGRAALASALFSVGDPGFREGLAADQFPVLHGLYWCLVNLSDERPVALLIDDAHLADELSLRFLVYAAQRLEDLPIVLAVAFRSDEPTGARSQLLAHLRAARTEPVLRPRTLSLPAAASLIGAAQLPFVVDDEFVRSSWEMSSGNPFLLQELLATIRSAPEAWSAHQPSDVAEVITESVGRSVSMRLSRLGDDEDAVVRACAVLGDDVPLRLAADLAEIAFAAAADAAERLVQSRVLGRIDPPAFVHPLVRTAIERRLSAGERPVLHLNAARLLHRENAPAEAVARHLVEGVPTGEAWAVRALHDAARDVARKGAPALGARYLRRAVDVASEDQRSAEMLIDLGLVEAAAGEETSAARFEGALAIVTDEDEKSRALYALGRTLFRHGRHDDAAAVFRRGAEMYADTDPDRALEFKAAHASAGLVTAFGASDWDPAEATAVAERGPRNQAERVMLVATALEWCVTVPPVATAAAWVRSGLGHGALVREQTSESVAVNQGIVTLLWCGLPTEALDEVAPVLDDARSRNAAMAFAEASMVRAMVMYDLGRLSEAQADAQSAIEGTEWGWHAFGPLPHAFLALCLIERGHLDRAEATIAAAHAPTSGSSVVLNLWLAWARARLCLARHDAAGALRAMLEVGEVLDPVGVASPAVVPWRSLGGFSAHLTGDTARGHEMIAEEVDLAQRFGHPGCLGAALAMRARVEDEGTALATIEEAVDVLEATDHRLRLAHAVLDHGALLRRSGHRTEARDVLGRALELARETGATAAEQRANDEILASGGKPRHRPHSGIDALTPSERRIAGLASDGLANREIAEALFLSKNTVDWHMRRIFRKLDIGSRDLLGERLTRLD